jgi:hypothetical protein
MIKPGLMAALKDYKRAMHRQDVLRAGPSPVDPLLPFQRWLWVDALSIHQDDTVEKSEQIQGMHQIYRGASRVMATLGGSLGEYDCVALVCEWLNRAIRCHLVALGKPAALGKDTLEPIEREMPDLVATLERAFDLSSVNLGALQSMANAVVQKSLTTSDSEFRTLHQEALRDRAHIPNDHEFWASCIKIFEHEWFSRVWTFQELQLGGAGGGIFLSLGDCCINWATVSILRSMVTLVVTLSGSYGRPLDDLSLRNRLFIHSPQQELELSNSDAAGLLDDDLCKMFCISAGRRATVKKDHVYALLGLMSPELRKLFSVDYSASDAEVFVRALKAEMGVRGGSCEFLLPLLWERLARISPKTVGLPSWCPDLSNESRSSTAPFGDTKLSLAFTQACSTFANFRFLSDGNLLCLSLMPLDTVAMSAEIPCPAPDIEAYSLRTDENVQEHFCAPTRMGAWINHLVDFEESSGVGNIVLGHFLWQYSHTTSVIYDDIFEPGVEVFTCETKDHHLGFTQSACKCVSCLTTLALSMSFLCSFFRHNDRRYTIPRTGETSGQHIPCVDFFEAAFALTLGSGLFKRSKGPAQKLGQDEQEQSIKYLNRVMEYSLTMMHCLHGMYVFTTTTGHFGCSPKRPSAGDLFTAVPGGEFLHIISSDKSRYVGAASVHGFMGDALLEHVQELGNSMEEVTLH